MSFTKYDEQAIAHAWKFFEIHASHRMQTINYFFLTQAFLFAGYVQADSHNARLVALMIATLGCIVVVAFHRMERRIRDLVHESEAVLKIYQKRLAVVTAVSCLNLFANVEYPKPGSWKFSKVMGLLHWASFTAFVLGAAFELVQMGGFAKWGLVGLIAAEVVASSGLIFYSSYILRYLSGGPKYQNTLRNVLALLLGVLAGVAGIAIAVFLALVLLPQFLH